MLSVDFLIVDLIPCGRFHANISRIPNIGETVSLAFKGSVDQYFEVVDVITAIPCDACGLQEFDAAYVVKLRRKEENKEMFSCTAELKTDLENQENLAAAAKNIDNSGLRLRYQTVLKKYRKNSLKCCFSGILCMQKI